jgi:hypothetical protein
MGGSIEDASRKEGLKPKPDTELPELGFGCAAGNGGGSLGDHPKTRAGRGVLS